MESKSPGINICADSEAGGLLPIQALPSETQVYQPRQSHSTNNMDKSRSRAILFPHSSSYKRADVMFNIPLSVIAYLHLLKDQWLLDSRERVQVIAGMKPYKVMTSDAHTGA